MPRFLYNANTLAVGGIFTRPFNYHLDPESACVLGSCGGRTSAADPAFRLEIPESGRLVLAYESANTSITSEEKDDGSYITTSISAVKGFNVLDTLKADEVVFQMTTTCNAETKRYTADCTATHFTNLTVSGEPFDVAIDYTMSAEAADYAAFKAAHPELPEQGGKIYYSLARNPKLKFDTNEFGYLDVPDFGRIYFAEWTVAPGDQSVNMLRLRLGSPTRGDVTAGSGHGNGAPFPP